MVSCYSFSQVVRLIPLCLLIGPIGPEVKRVRGRWAENESPHVPSPNLSITELWVQIQLTPSSSYVNPDATSLFPQYLMNITDGVTPNSAHDVCTSTLQYWNDLSLDMPSFLAYFHQSLNFTDEDYFVKWQMSRKHLSLFLQRVAGPWYIQP